MYFHVLTLFPEMIEHALSQSITGRALKQNIISLQTVNIRDFSENKHKKVDDYTYGGGAGMLMQAEPVYRAIDSVINRIESTRCEEKATATDIAASSENTDSKVSSSVLSSSTSLGTTCRVIYVTPQGSVFNQEMAREFAKCDDLIFLCGHYEGIDERVLEEIVTDYVSIGDYVLTGGELPAMVMIDAISRLVPRVLHNDVSAETESFHGRLLEYPQYSRPAVWHDKPVPSVLMSGNQKQIDAWRLEQSIKRTKERRPDIYEQYKRLDECRKFLKENKLLHIDMIELINRGNANIVYFDGKECILSDLQTGIWFHTRPDGDAAACRQTLCKIMRDDKSYGLMPHNNLLCDGNDSDSDETMFSSQNKTTTAKQRCPRCLVTHQPQFIEAFKSLGYHVNARCIQLSYTNKEKLSVSGLYRSDGKPMKNGLVIRCLDESFFPEVKELYSGHDEDEYLLRRLRDGAVYGAFLLHAADCEDKIIEENIEENIEEYTEENKVHAGKDIEIDSESGTRNDTGKEIPVGIIGFHEEGSIGMLSVAPKYRRMKIGMALETFIFNQAIEKGRIPYVQVIIGNDVSIALQNKLRLNTAKGEVVWMECFGTN